MALRIARVGVYVVLVAMFSAGLWLTEHRFDQALDDQCSQANNGRDDLRRALADTLTENLVEIAARPPDPAVIDRYKAGLLDDLEREFPDRHC